MKFFSILLIFIFACFFKNADASSFRGKTVLDYFFKLPTTATTTAVAKTTNTVTVNSVSSIRSRPTSASLPAFEGMEIGGLDEEFSKLARRIFLSRLYSDDVVKNLGLKHVRGILLYGPPGTGKTLMAREMAKVLKSHEPKIVNGPELVNKYHGESERNIRNLFSAAKAEYKVHGDKSKLHLIVFDEMDATFKKRGGKDSLSDSIVNQLLSELDGVNELNNILVVGTTNRVDLIDPALLRPGRFEVHLKIGLPDEYGRLQIFNIHTSQLRERNYLSHDVDMEELASLTKNFTGAEISGIVKSATSFALERVSMGLVHINRIKISREDFLNALAEIKPAFGFNDFNFSSIPQHGIIDYHPNIKQLFFECKLQVGSALSQPEKGRIVSLLLHGPAGSGKTSFAIEVAKLSKRDFAFVKMISPDSLVGMSEEARIHEIVSIFQTAYNSEASFIIIDSIEKLVNYYKPASVPYFSIAVLDTIQVCLKRIPPKNCSILVISTSENHITDVLNLNDCFTTKLAVPPIDSMVSVFAVLRSTNFFENKEKEHIENVLSSLHFDKFSIPVKKLLNLLSATSQDRETGSERFISEFVLIARSQDNGPNSQ